MSPTESRPAQAASKAAGKAASSAKVVTTAVVRAAERLALSNRVLAGVLGLSEASVSRMTAQSYQLDPDSKPYELAVLFLRLYRSLDTLVDGDVAAARAWLRNDNTALGATPLSQIATVAGLVNVIGYLDARRTHF